MTALPRQHESPTPPTPFALTDEQRRIIEWDEGPAAAIAGAGTGKTRLIVERVRHLLEATDAAWPEGPDARHRFADDLAGTGQAAAMAADEARAAGLDPLTLRSVGADSGAGANLLQVASLPPRFSCSALTKYDACGLQYAFQYLYRIPEPPNPAPALSFGSMAHAAFEAFTRDRRERAALGEPPPTRDDLEREFRTAWDREPAAFGDRVTEERYGRRVATLLDNFWEGEVVSLGEALHEELEFELRLDPGEGSAEPIVFHGSIDRIDRLPSGGIEVIDYKTGRVQSQKGVDESLQLSIYALACRDALDLGTPERVTLYFTESALRLSTTRTDEQLDAARGEILERVSRMRAGEFPAQPGKACGWCAYRAMCPERV